MNFKSNELNDLFDYGYKIYQNKEYFKFSIDSVLLAEFVLIHKNQKKLLDMCSGNCPIPMILLTKYKKDLDITAVELQPEIYELGVSSLKYNKLNNINYLNMNVKDIPDFINEKFDIITCNPPYFPYIESSKTNDNNIKAIARHELTVNLEDIINIAAKMLKNSGYLYLVHRPERIADIINLLHKYNFGVKSIQPVYNDKDSKATIVLVESIYNGKDYVIINSPLFIKEHTTFKNIFGR